ncbi:MAG: hypothetical protein J7K81_07495 [Methanophagales archaeon]|nr:hypothetical protein [Methanophagales archaeon]
MANMVNVLSGQTLGKFDHQTFKKGLIQTNAFRKSLTKNAAQASQKESVEEAKRKGFYYRGL